jgi:hypothetical protein
MKIERVDTKSLTENRLPDGSRILVDASNEKVFALNATAGAAWEACSTPTTLAQMTTELQRTVNPEASEELAADAVRQLEEQELVKTSGPALSSRRAFIGTMGAVAALPVVAALTLGEQRAYAQHAVSGKRQPTAPAPPPPPPPPPPPWWWPF